MEVSDLVIDETTGKIGLVLNKWMDENDEYSYSVEFFDSSVEMIYWSDGRFMGCGNLEDLEVISR